MNKVLLVDFGASRVKSVVIDTDTHKVLSVKDVPSPSTKSLTDGDRFEVDPELYWIALENTAGELIKQYDIDSMWICSEMHGCVLTNEQGTPVTNYISWKDQRSIEDLKTYTDRFLLTTGMKLRTGLPWSTLYSIKDTINSTVHLHTLVDWLLVRGGCSTPKSHVTMAAGTGFYDILDHSWSNTLLNLISVSPDKIKFNPVTKDIEHLGTIHLSGKNIQVYGGIGDLQAAVFGAWTGKVDAVINLGTGSQVVTRPSGSFINQEFRPFVKQDLIKVITHIPCGRALSIIAEFVDSIAGMSGGNPIFWQKWCQLTVDEVVNATVIADLNLFSAAWKHSENSGWISLKHGSDFKLILAGIAKSWLTQYISVINILDPNHTIQTVAVTGGLSRKGEFVVPVLAELDCTRFYQRGSLTTDEETLDGLLALTECTPK
jgi:glycerol kinase